MNDKELGAMSEGGFGGLYLEMGGKRAPEDAKS